MNSESENANWILANTKICQTDATKSCTKDEDCADAGKCLERLEIGQWLVKSDDGHYSLGVRTELQRRYMSAEEPEEGAAQVVQEVD